MNMNDSRDKDKQQYRKDHIKIKLKVISHKQEKFAKILKLDGLSPIDVTSSLKLDKNIKNICKAGQGVGKSGSFFFYSSDNKFILKTMTSSEKKVILDLVDDLINYYEVVNN